MRSGLITQKVGMTRIFNDDGSHLPVTVLKVEDLQVVATLPTTPTATSLFSLVMAKRK